MPKKNPMERVKDALGVKDEGKPAASTEAEEEPEAKEQQAAQEQPAQTQAEAKKEAQKPEETPAVKPISADDLLKSTGFLQLVPIHYFMVVPVQNDEQKILIGYTIENNPVVKILASGIAIANLKLALQKA